MRFEDGIKLDYDDILIKPKRSTLYSRAAVDLKKRYKFRNSKREWEGIPIIAANMAGVGTWEMAKVFWEYKMAVALTREERDKPLTNYSFTTAAIPTFGITPPHFISL